MTAPSHVVRTADLLRRHRFSAGLTQRELAAKAQVSVRTLRYLEQGSVERPHASSIRRLGAALELTGADLDLLLGTSTRTGARPDPGTGPSAVPGTDRTVRIGVLGPLTVRHGGAVVELESVMIRGLLGILAVQPARAVARDEIIDVLWEGNPPRTCENLIHTYVAALRRILEPQRRRGTPATVVRRVPGGYRLDLGPGQLDLAAFDDLADRAHRALADGATQAAWALYTGSGTRPAGRPAGGSVERCGTGIDAWWQGTVLAGSAPSLRSHPAVVAVEQRRVRAVGEFADLAAALGRGEQVVGPLREALAREPLHESLAAHLMLALADAGRQASALELYDTMRRRLDTDLGVEPGPQLRSAHLRVLRGQPAPPAVTTARPTDADATGAAAIDALPPSQLPVDLAAFTGRERYLRTLDEMLAGRGGRPAGVVVISTIAGMGGVGKTALAVHWAHRVSGNFPDGQLYVNLRGHSAGRTLRPLDALAGFLLALGVPAEHVPDDEHQAAALYRSRLAGKRVLVLLDNAIDAEQVRPLLPSSPGSFALVTSRDRLAGLLARDGARPLPLDVLRVDEAVALLSDMLGPDRVAAEPAATAELARLCAYLPLALRIAGANLYGQPRYTIADYVTELSTGDRLAALAVDGDADTALRSTFELSYVALPAQERRMFRAIGLFPGSEITAEVAGVLTGHDTTEARKILLRLASRHLLGEQAAGRYVAHDLLRLYAMELADAHGEERRPALTRLAEHYRHMAGAAAELLYPHVLRVPVDQPAPVRAFAAAPAALAWLDAERANLVSTVGQLAEQGHHADAWRLADALHGYFWIRMDAVHWQLVAEPARAAAESDGDLHALACSEINLGLLADMQSRFDVATKYYTAALAVARKAQWARCEAVALNNFARCGPWRSGRLADAIECLTGALALHRRMGRVAGTAVTLANLGVAQWELGRSGDDGPSRFARAVNHLNEALTLHRRIGDQRNEADTLRVLACVHRDAGDLTRALDLAERALATARAAGDLRFETAARNALATVRARLGDERGALEQHGSAVELTERIGDRQQAAAVLLDFADTLLRLGRRDEALVRAQEAERTSIEIGWVPLQRQAQRFLDTI